MSRKEAEKRAEVHAIEDLGTHARKSGHYYKQRGATDELPSRGETTQITF